jgi:cell division initiation protein
MEITPRELRDVEIREAFRGYSHDEVNELLERAAATLDAANERLQQMTERLNTAQSETGHTRETEDILHRTLLLAQRAADEAVNEATAKARQMVDDAEIQARRTIADAEADARRRGETERRRLEEEVLDFATRRDTLLADVEALTRFEADFRDRMVRALEADLSALRSRPFASPGARPEPSEVELPEKSEGFTRREHDDAAPSSFSTPQPAPPASYQPAPPQPWAAPPAPSDRSSEPSPPDPTQSDASDSTHSDSTHSDSTHSDSTHSDSSRESDASTQAVDVQSLFDRAGGASASSRAFEQQAAATATAQSRPGDPGAGEAIEAEVLDDDAFFATLREAVHDETPLGPRDQEEATGEHSFFDSDDDRVGFRDVFRRRR